jgi:2-polyprenyl-6-hydroxyphenyl methylase / 3-demethylubiquinone-9 3-methyltransferase
MTTLDPAEVEKFSQLAAIWWDEKGKMGVLHKFNPVRLKFIRDQLCQQFSRDPMSLTPLTGLRLLDIGCGGGLLSEPLARMGATVIGADPARNNIETAKIHAEQSGIAVDYRMTTAEELHAAGEKFDCVLAMEVVEHVADRTLFMRSCADMVKPDGLLFAATLNRTLKSLLLAKIGAEYVLGWLPKGTHDWHKFVTPEELISDLHDMTILEQHGVFYHLLKDAWLISKDMDVNYMLVAKKN